MVYRTGILQYLMRVRINIGECFREVRIAELRGVSGALRCLASYIRGSPFSCIQRFVPVQKPARRLQLAGLPVQNICTDHELVDRSDQVALK